jgi:hypothetical protein
MRVLVKTKNLTLLTTSPAHFRPTRSTAEPQGPRAGMARQCLWPVWVALVGLTLFHCYTLYGDMVTATKPQVRPLPLHCLCYIETKEPLPVSLLQHTCDPPEGDHHACE